MVYQQEGRYYAKDSKGNLICVDSPTSCIQEAVDIGGLIVIKSGTYVLNAKSRIPWSDPDTQLYAGVVVKKPFTYIVGVGNVWIKLGDNVGGSVIGIGSGANAITIEGLFIDGNSQNNPDTGIDGDLTGIIPSMDVSMLTIRDIYVTNTTREGFYLHGMFSHFENLMADSAGVAGYDGIVLDAVTYSSVFNLKAINSGRNGVYIIGAAMLGNVQNTLNVDGISVYNSKRHGVHIIHAQGISISNIVARRNAYDGIFVEDSEGVNLINTYSLENNRNGIYLFNSKNISIINAFLLNNRYSCSDPLGSGIMLYNTKNAHLIAIKAYDNRSAPCQHYAIEEVSGSTSDYNILIGGVLTPNALGAYYLVGTQSKILNADISTRTTGQATIPAGATSVVVNHGLICTPTKLFITPLAQPPGQLWVSNINNTSFTINTSSPPTSDLPISWYAEC
jgi:parallel beta-helix repeat protein